MQNGTSHSSQFTLREILFATTLTFAGMVVLNSVAFSGKPALGCVVALIAIAVGGYAALRLSVPNTAERCYAMVMLYVSVAIVLVFVINVGPQLRINRIMRQLFGLLLFGSLPAFVGFFIAVRLFPADTFTEGERWKRVCLLTLTTGCIALLGSSMIYSQFFVTRCSGSSTAAAATCKAYAEAQVIYSRVDYDGNGVKEYARTMFGANSLLETKAGAGDLLLIDPSLALAAWEHPQRQPKAGYFFKVLHAGGSNHPYIDADGYQTRGFAMLAFPSAYDRTGRDSFLIDNRGTIYQKDLGPHTLKIAAGMTDFQIDDTWIPTE